MRLLNSRDSFSLVTGFTQMVDFCIWALQIDGLNIPPFDTHPDGNGVLRAAGLNAENWQAWLIHVVDQQYQHRQALEQQQQKHPFGPPDWKSMPMPPQPISWIGDTEVAKQLEALWAQYTQKHVERERKMEDMLLSRKRSQIEHEQGTNLWQDLKPYHSRIPTLIIHTVRYNQPINYLIPPVSVVMSQPSITGFRERVLDAAAGITASTVAQRRVQKEYKLSIYTSPNQPVPLFKTFPPQPEQSVAPRPKAHIVAENALKQIVLDHLIKPSRMFGEVDLASVQFLKEKAIPGWQWYYVIMSDFDSHTQIYTIMLKQEDDGSWRWKSATSARDLNDAAIQQHVPIHDHPIIDLSGSNGHDGSEYAFIAYGKIIDNGFAVTRVRLTNEASQIFEDTVQDDFVFFASIGEQKIQWPMQVELYNDAGELLWSQKVFDYSLPPWTKKRI